MVLALEPSTPQTIRRHDLDWLRALATLNVFLFHCARLFNDEDWHVKDPRVSGVATVFISFTVVYIMPLFFMLSAASSSFSLERRASGQYLSERFRRLMVPLLFGSVFVIAPIQVWIERATHPPFYPHSFTHFMLHDYFHGFYLFGGNFAWVGIHLWYLLFLFVFSLLTLPLFRLLLRPRAKALIERLAAVGAYPGGLYLYAAPIVLIELMVNLNPDAVGGKGAGGWSILTYLVYFIVGFIFFLDRLLHQAVIDRRRLSLLTAVSLSIFFAAVKTGAIDPGPAGYWVWSIGWTLCSWSWIMAIFGLAGKHLAFHRPVLAYLNDLVLPFYILHQTVIVMLGFFLRGWDLSVALKYPLVVAVAFIVVMSIYEFGARRTRPTRFLFGMKEKTSG